MIGIGVPSYLTIAWSALPSLRPSIDTWTSPLSLIFGKYDMMSPMLTAVLLAAARRLNTARMSRWITAPRASIRRQASSGICAALPVMPSPKPSVKRLADAIAVCRALKAARRRLQTVACSLLNRSMSLPSSGLGVEVGDDHVDQIARRLRTGGAVVV